MNLNLVVGVDRDRHPLAMFILLGCTVAVAACSSGGGGTAGTGGRGGAAAGTGGKVTGTGGSAVGDAGTGGAPADAASDAPSISDVATDTAPLPCILDGGAASGDCCPDDPLKTQPGACGCGVADDDSDYDGTPDCHDMCPGDPSKTVPGACGCFIADTDTDLDGTPDCHDACPKNPARQTQGLCGCALPDSAAPLCLAHRYRFDDPAGDAGVGGVVRDSVGTANGTAMNVALNGSGTLTLAGGISDQYVALPSGIISALGNSATFEVWFTWTGPTAAWERVFDFGANDSTTPGGQGMVGTAFVFFTPNNPAGVPFLSVNTVGLTEVAGTTSLSQNSAQPHHVACVIDGGGAGDGGGPTVTLYVDGAMVGRVPSISTLSGLNDANNWLGRSQFMADTDFAGTYYDFRIHSSALTQQQISASFAAGPDAP